MDKTIGQSPSLNTTKRLGHRTQYGGGRLPSESQLGHRVRIPTDDLDNVEKTSPRLQGRELAADTSTSTYGKLAPIFLVSPVEDVLSRQRPFVKAAIGLYCFLSCMVFSLGIYNHLHDRTLAVLNTSDRTFQERNPLQSLPINHILSKATSLYPIPNALDPFVLRAAVEPTGITACLWSTDQDIYSITPWATRWTGSISLAVTTTAEPSSAEHENLLVKLADLQRRSTLLNATLSVHLVHLAPAAPANPNAFLNLARLFAQTPRVVLFPGNLTITPPKLLYASLVAQDRHASAAIAPAPASAPRRRPTVLTTRGQTSFPFSPLAPVVIGRDDPLWCTERFFTPADRAPDWEECLWQIWLENFGDVDVQQTRGWLHDALPGAPSSSESLTMAKLRRRLAGKFRSETCVLATRQLAAFRSADRALDAKKTRWLKRVCRAWTNGPHA